MDLVDDGLDFVLGSAGEEDLGGVTGGEGEGCLGSETAFAWACYEDCRKDA